jgi:hypothetical protein
MKIMFKILILINVICLVCGRPDVSHLLQSGSQNGGLVSRPSGFLDYRSNVGPDGKTVIKRPIIKHGEPIVTKDFFIHTAPNDEGPEIQYEDVEYTVNPRIHYNILFAKAPTSSGGNISLNNVAVAPEYREKTIVYVLAGDNVPFDVSGGSQIDLPKPSEPSQPELVFVRYNKEDDIKSVVNKIQSHYNSQHSQNVQDFNVLGAEPKTGYNNNANNFERRSQLSQDQEKSVESSAETPRNFEAQAVNDQISGFDNIDLANIAEALQSSGQSESEDPNEIVYLDGGAIKSSNVNNLDKPDVNFVKYSGNDDDVSGIIQRIQDYYNSQDGSSLVPLKK